MGLNCDICKKEFKTVRSLSDHLKSHRVAAKTYFEKYYPRVDLLDGTKIKFKSLEQYFLTDFKDKTSLKKWLRQIGKEKASIYCSHKIKKYCEIKGMNYAPPSFFIDSLAYLPSIRFIELYCGQSYTSLAESVGLKVKYEYNDNVCNDFHLNVKSPARIVIDTREKTPLKFDKSIKVIRLAMSYGDYSLSAKSSVVVERKSQNDLFGTLSVGYDRFCREMERAREDNGYLVVVVEATYNSLAYPVFSKWRRGPNPEYIFHKMREIYRNYNDVCQFVFCDGRREMSEWTLKILSLGKKAKMYDINYILSKKNN
jgi:hypothetical protein